MIIYPCFDLKDTSLVCRQSREYIPLSENQLLREREKWILLWQILQTHAMKLDTKLIFIFRSFLPNILRLLGDSLLQVCSWHFKLHYPTGPALWSVPSAIYQNYKRIRVGNLRFVRRPLPGRAETASSTKNWVSQVGLSYNFYNNVNILIHNSVKCIPGVSVCLVWTSVGA